MSSKLTTQEESRIMKLATDHSDKSVLARFGEKNIAELHTAMMQSSHEMMLAIEDVLTRQFGFTDQDIKVFHDRITDILNRVKEYEDQGYNMISPSTIKAIGDIAILRLAKNTDTTPKHITANIDGGILLVENKRGKELMEGKKIEPNRIEPKSQWETKRALPAKGH